MALDNNYGWRPVAAPNFSGANQALTNASTMITEGMGTIADAGEKAATRDMTRQLQSAQVSKAQSEATAAEEDLKLAPLKKKLLGAQAGEVEQKISESQQNIRNAQFAQKLQALEYRKATNAFDKTLRDQAQQEKVDKLSELYFNNTEVIADETMSAEFILKKAREMGIKGPAASAALTSLTTLRNDSINKISEYANPAMTQDTEAFKVNMDKSLRDAEDIYITKLQDADLDVSLVNQMQNVKGTNLQDYEKHAIDVLKIEANHITEAKKTFEKIAKRPLTHSWELAAMIGSSVDRGWWFFDEDKGIDSPSLKDNAERLSKYLSEPAQQAMRKAQDAKEIVKRDWQAKQTELQAYQLKSKYDIFKSVMQGNGRLEYKSKW